MGSSGARSAGRVYALLAVVMVFWCGNSIVGRAVRHDIPPFTLAFVRWSLGLLIVVPLAWRSLRADWPTIRHHWHKILLLGVVGIASFNALLYSGLRETTATNALLIQAGIPTLVLVFDRCLFGSRAPAARVVGVALSALGVLTIVFRADYRVLLALNFGRGDAFIVASVVAWALYTALLRLRPPIAHVSFLVLTFVVGAVCMFPLASLEWQSMNVNLTKQSLAAIGYVAIFPSVIAYLLFNKAVAEIGPAAAGQTISMQPLIGAVLAASLLGESLYAYHGVGMMLILVGIAVPMIFRTSSTDRARS